MMSRLAAVAALACVLTNWTMDATATDCSRLQVHVPRYDVTMVGGDKTVGQPIEFKWRIDDKLTKISSPTYLVLSTTGPVRFEGQGFFAIAPGARGPHGMIHSADRTRAIVPLQGEFAASKGSISLLLFRAGATSVEWGIFQTDKCGGSFAKQRETIEFDVNPGAPQLLGRDEFAFRQPDKIVTPREGGFEARVFSGSIQVADRATGEIVVQTGGVRPVFSPTGRFLSVETGEKQLFDVFDLAAQRRLGRFESVEGLYWSHQDSFLYVDYGWSGTMGIIRTLHTAGEAVDTQPAPPEDNFDTAEQVAEVDLAALDGAIKTPSAAIDPGSGGFGMLGSEAWSVDISIETGLAIFLNTNWVRPGEIDSDYSDGVEFGGRIIDLGRQKPMIRTRDSHELNAVLRDRFGLSGVRPTGWDAAGGLRRTYSSSHSEDEAEGELSPTSSNDVNPDWAAFQRSFIFSDEPTQREDTLSKRRSVASDASLPLLRGAISIVSPPRGHTIPGAEELTLLDQRGIRNLRSGKDNTALEAISAELGLYYDKAVALWQKSANVQGYETQSFPVPNPDPLPDEPKLIDLTAEGRDTWAWTIGGESFWMTQTVVSGRRGHGFRYSMLRLRDRHLTRVDVLRGNALNEDEGDDALFQMGDYRGSMGDVFVEPSFVAVAGERYLLIATKPVPRLIVFDLARMRPVCRVLTPANPANLERLALSKSGEHLFQFDRDGQVSVYDCKDGARVLTGLFADEELVVMDRSGYFDGSQDATAYVELKVMGLPGRQVLSQFASKLRRPGLLRSIIRREYVEQPPQALFPPALTVSRSDAKDGGFDLRAESHSELRSLEVFGNGRLVLRRELSGRSSAISIGEQDLPTGGFATAVITDAEGLTSAPKDIFLDKRASRSPGRLIGLAVGVDDYPGLSGNDLKFAAADARRVAAAVRKSKLYARADIKVLVDREATAAAILKELDRIIVTAGEGDTILLSFAAHGLIASNNRLHLALSETVAAEFDRTSLNVDAVVARLQNAKSKAIVLLDACHAGASSQSGEGTNDIAVRQLVTAAGSGIIVLAASKGRQFSEETAAIGGGRFSVAFARTILKGRIASDLDGNGAISVLELYRSVKENVSAATNGRQIPWMARNQIVGDFDVF